MTAREPGPYIVADDNGWRVQGPGLGASGVAFRTEWQADYECDRLNRAHMTALAQAAGELEEAIENGGRLRHLIAKWRGESARQEGE